MPSMYSTKAEKQRAYRCRKDHVPYVIIGGLVVREGEMGYPRHLMPESHDSSHSNAKSNGERKLDIMRCSHEQMLKNIMFTKVNRGTSNKRIEEMTDFFLNQVYADVKRHYES